MFSSLSQNSILYVFDINGNTKILSGPIERVSLPRPKYTSFNHNMEMVVDITAVINGERREFKGVPNNSVADFGDDSFILAENKEALTSYINTMLNNSEAVINSIDKHENRVNSCKEALQELNPALKENKERDKAIQSLQDQMVELKQLILGMTDKRNT